MVTVALADPPGCRGCRVSVGRPARRSAGRRGRHEGRAGGQGVHHGDAGGVRRAALVWSTCRRAGPRAVPDPEVRLRDGDVRLRLHGSVSVALLLAGFGSLPPRPATVTVWTSVPDAPDQPCPSRGRCRPADKQATVSLMLPAPLAVHVDPAEAVHVQVAPMSAAGTVSATVAPTAASARRSRPRSVVIASPAPRSSGCRFGNREVHDGWRGRRTPSPSPRPTGRRRGRRRRPCRRPASRGAEGVAAATPAASLGLLGPRGARAHVDVEGPPAGGAGRGAPTIAVSPETVTAAPTGRRGGRPRRRALLLGPGLPERTTVGPRLCRGGAVGRGRPATTVSPTVPRRCRTRPRRRHAAVSFALRPRRRRTNT